MRPASLPKQARQTQKKRDSNDLTVFSDRLSKPQRRRASQIIEQEVQLDVQRVLTVVPVAERLLSTAQAAYGWWQATEQKEGQHVGTCEPGILSRHAALSAAEFTAAYVEGMDAKRHFATLLRDQLLDSEQAALYGVELHTDFSHSPIAVLSKGAGEWTVAGEIGCAHPEMPFALSRCRGWRAMR